MAKIIRVIAGRPVAALALLGSVLLTACSSGGTPAATTVPSATRPPATHAPSQPVTPAASASSDVLSSFVVHPLPSDFSAQPFRTQPATAGRGTCGYLTPVLAHRLLPGTGNGGRTFGGSDDSCSYVDPHHDSMIMLDETLGASRVRAERGAFHGIALTLGARITRPSGIGAGAVQYFRRGIPEAVEWISRGRDFELTLDGPGVTSAQVTAAARAVAARTRSA